MDQWENQEWELPKLILLDLHLPTAEQGWTFLEQLKAMAPPHCHIPVIVLTVSTNEQDVDRAYSLGAASYIVKPIRFSEWETLIQTVITYWLDTARLPPLQFPSSLW